MLAEPSAPVLACPKREKRKIQLGRKRLARLLWFARDTGSKERPILVVGDLLGGGRLWTGKGTRRGWTRQTSGASMASAVFCLFFWEKKAKLVLRPAP